MQVNFRFQVDGVTGATRPGEAFPVVELLEYRRADIDYALVRLGRRSDGRLPGEVYGTLVPAAGAHLAAGSMLCMIQHPSGRPKRIGAGPMRSNMGGRIEYDTLDTEGGSSGSPILSTSAGELIGVHTNGGCTMFSGFNYGVSIATIRQVSDLL